MLKTKKRRESSSKNNFLKRIWPKIKILLLALVAITAILVGVFFIWVSTLKIPDIQDFSSRTINESSKIYDSSGEIVLYDVFKEEKRTIVGYDDIADSMKLAILAIEDDQFYTHSGVRISAYISAVWDKIKNPDSRLRGGSTITQQVIKNALLNNERALSRKIKEFVLALRLEQQLSKQEILEVYLNEIAFGGSVYGVEQASLSFFGKPAIDLTIAESAYLAAIPKAPTFYSPSGPNRDKLDTRKNVILNRMYELGFISKTAFDSAILEQVEFTKRVDRGIKAPHFVFFVREYLEEKYGIEALERGGMQIYTTLDWELQEQMEKIATEQAERVTQYKATNLASVTIENNTGHIISMVGSKDYFAEDIDGNFNIATALRQPGSTFKPFVYAAAFAEGYFPETIVWDVQTEFSSSCYPDGSPLLPEYEDRCYSPQNYDKRVRGPISLRNALAGSLNIPAVKALYLVGVSDAITVAKNLGINSLNRAASFYGLNLVLGGGEVELLEMTSAYGVFGNSGMRFEPTGILRVEDADGNILEEYRAASEQVIDANVANTINDVLSDNDAKRPIFGQNSQLYYENREVAVKTGTTNNYRDTWTVGYTPEYSVGVWVGNNDNTPMSSNPSSTIAGPFWRAAMDELLLQYSDKQNTLVFPESISGITDQTKAMMRGQWEGEGQGISIDITTGEIANENTDPENIQTLFVPNYHSLLHWVNKSDPNGPAPTNPASDGQYEYWEYGVQQWSGQNPIGGLTEDLLNLLNGGVSSANNETANTTTDTRDEPLQVSISSPISGETYAADQRLTITLDVNNKNDIDSIYYYVNNSFLGSSKGNSLETVFVPSRVRGIENTGNIIKAVIETEDGQRIEREVLFNIN